MSRYNLVKIEDLYLTNDGTSSGLPCKVEIPGLANFRLDQRRTIVLPIEGQPVMQKFDPRIGEPLSISIFLLNKTEYETLLEIINDAEEDDELISIEITGELGDFNFDCMLESIEQPGEFDSDRIPSLTTTWRIADAS